MSEPITFWMDNKNCVGKTAAIIGDQALIIYRDRYYVLQGGVSLNKGGKPLRFSLSSLPPLWKRALKGEAPLSETLPAESDSTPASNPQKRVRKKTEIPAMTEQKMETVAEKSETDQSLPTRGPKKSFAREAIQPPITANCPYCNSRHEIPLEKGKSGKPFFISCDKCKCEFAVRFMPVTVYQAQVAGFR